MGYNAVLTVENQPTFRSKMLLPSSGAKNMPSKKPASSLTLKMEATCSSET
jgi:hypothetical protein